MTFTAVKNYVEDFCDQLGWASKTVKGETSQEKTMFSSALEDLNQHIERNIKLNKVESFASTMVSTVNNMFTVGGAAMKLNLMTVIDVALTVISKTTANMINKAQAVYDSQKSDYDKLYVDFE